jgi:hypothetical protein
MDIDSALAYDVRDDEEKQDDNEGKQDIEVFAAHESHRLS